MDKRPLYLLADIGLLRKDVVDAAEEGQTLLRARCPVHPTAECPSSFALKTEYWMCNSEKCHEVYGTNPEGLIAALAERFAPPGLLPEARGVPLFKPARLWLKNNAARLREHFEDWPTAKAWGSGRAAAWAGCTRQWAKECLVGPDPYFMSRGFSPDTLKRYCIGQPRRRKRGSPFSNRGGCAIVPLPDLDRPDWCVGYLARDPHGTKDKRWRASPGLPASQMLFNYRAAKAANARTGRLLFVEGVPDALRCVEAGHREVLAALGSSLGKEQVERLAGFRLDEVVVIADKDPSGDQFARQVRERLAGRAGVVKVIRCPDHFKDVGEMSTSAAREFLAEALR